jgi:hypothetical protein
MHVFLHSFIQPRKGFDHFIVSILKIKGSQLPIQGIVLWNTTRAPYLYCQSQPITNATIAAILPMLHHSQLSMLPSQPYCQCSITANYQCFHRSHIVMLPSQPYQYASIAAISDCFHSSHISMLPSQPY